MTKISKILTVAFRRSPGIKRVALQAMLGLDDAAFEVAASGARMIRVRGQGGGFWPV